MQGPRAFYYGLLSPDWEYRVFSLTLFWKGLFPFSFFNFPAVHFTLVFFGFFELGSPPGCFASSFSSQA